MNGNNIIVLKDGTAVAACKSSEIQTSAGTIEIANATDQQWKDFIAERKEWSLNVSYLVTAAADIEKLLEVGTEVTILMRDRSDTHSLTGQAIVTTCKQTFSRGSLSNGSYSFRGKGALSVVQPEVEEEETENA